MRIEMSQVLKVPEREVLAQPDDQLGLRQEPRSEVMTGLSAPTG